MKSNVKSVVMLFITAIIWGFAFAAQRAGAEFLGPFYFNGIRFVLGTLSLVPVIVLFEKVPRNGSKFRGTFLFGLAAGVILFSASALQQFGIELTGSAGKSGFITGLYIVIVPLLGIFFKKKTGIFTWIAAFLSAAGLYMLCGGGTSFGAGDIVLLAGSFLWAGHIIIIDAAGPRIYPLRFAFTQFAVCSVLSLSSAFLFEDITFSAVSGAAIPLLYGGLMSVGIAYTLQILGQRDSDPAFASIVLSTETVFSAVGGALIFGESMTPQGYAGCVMIFAGILLTQIKPSKLTLGQKDREQ